MTSTMQTFGGLGVALMTEPTALEKHLKHIWSKYHQRRAEIEANHILSKVARPNLDRAEALLPGIELGAGSRAALAKLLHDVEVADRRADAIHAAICELTDGMNETERFMPDLIEWSRR